VINKDTHHVLPYCIIGVTASVLFTSHLKVKKKHENYHRVLSHVDWHYNLRIQVLVWSNTAFIFITIVQRCLLLISNQTSLLPYFSSDKEYEILPKVSHTLFAVARFSKVPVTFRARSCILKSKSIERWRSFSPAYQPDLFYQLRILLFSFQNQQNLSL